MMNKLGFDRTDSISKNIDAIKIIQKRAEAAAGMNIRLVDLSVKLLKGLFNTVQDEFTKPFITISILMITIYIGYITKLNLNPLLTKKQYMLELCKETNIEEELYDTLMIEFEYMFTSNISSLIQNKDGESGSIAINMITIAKYLVQN